MFHWTLESTEDELSCLLGDLVTQVPAKSLETQVGVREFEFQQLDRILWKVPGGQLASCCPGSVSRLKLQPDFQLVTVCAT